MDYDAPASATTSSPPQKKKGCWIVTHVGHIGTRIYLVTKSRQKALDYIRKQNYVRASPDIRYGHPVPNDWATNPDLTTPPLEFTVHVNTYQTFYRMCWYPLDEEQT